MQKQINEILQKKQQTMKNQTKKQKSLYSLFNDSPSNSRRKSIVIRRSESFKQMTTSFLCFS